MAAQASLQRWPGGELRSIAEVDDLHLAPFRGDGATYGTPTWIWSVAVNRELYARAYNGRRSRWYQAAMHQRSGRIMAAGVICDVGFEVSAAPSTIGSTRLPRKIWREPLSRRDDRRRGPRRHRAHRAPQSKLKENRHAARHRQALAGQVREAERGAGRQDHARRDGDALLRRRVGLGGLEEVAAKDWMSKVYEPDIRAKLDTIYKKPGYENV